MASLEVSLDLNSSAFDRGLDRATQTAKKVGGAMAAALGAFGVAAVKQAADAQTAFAKLETIAGKDITKLKQQIMDLPPELGTVGSAAEAAYQAISASVKPAEAVDFVRRAAVAAKGGFTDMTTAVDAATTIMNSYGSAAGDSEAIFDKFLKTQNLGKTTFGEIGQSIGRVAATAKEFGIPFDELLGQIATLTASGIKTPEAMSQIRAAISNLQKPTDDAAAEMEKLGLKVEDIKRLGVTGFLDEIRQKSPDVAQSVANIFGSVEAGTAANVLIGRMETLKTNIEGIKNASGDAGQAAAIMGNTFNDKLAAVVSAAQRVGIALGNELLPEVEKVAKYLLDNMGNIQAMAQEVLATIKLVSGAIASVSSGLGAASAAVGQFAEGNVRGGVAALGGGEGVQAAADTAVSGASTGLAMSARALPGIGALLQIGDLFSGKGFAEGGSPPVGQFSVVGENGPELFMPRTAGTVLPGSGGIGGGVGSSEDFFENIKARIRSAFHSGAKEGLIKGGKDGVGSAKGKEGGLAATLFKGAFDSSKGAMMEGFKSGDVKGAIKTFAETLKEQATAMLKQAVIQGLGSKLASIFGGGGGIFGFADGGSPPVGRPSLVGERGPELFVPRTSGTIIPHESLGGISIGEVVVNASSREGGEAAADGFVGGLRALIKEIKNGNHKDLTYAIVADAGLA